MDVKIQNSFNFFIPIKTLLKEHNYSILKKCTTQLIIIIAGIINALYLVKLNIT